MNLKTSRVAIVVSVMLLALFGIVGQAFAYTPVPGDLLLLNGTTAIFIVDDNLQRIPIDFNAINLRYGPQWPVKRIDVTDLKGYTTDLVVNLSSSHANGTFIMYGLNDTDPVYVLDKGFKRPFASRASFFAAGHTLGQVAWVGTYEIYPTGSVAQ